MAGYDWEKSDSWLAQLRANRRSAAVAPEAEDTGFDPNRPEWRKQESARRKQAKNSLNVRNVQPTIKTFRGDPKLAAGYLPTANVLMGELENRMALGGVAQGAWAVQLPDGARIRVAKNGEVRQIEIDVKQLVVKEGVITLFLESGYVSLLLPQGMLYYMSPQREALEAGKYLDDMYREQEIRVSFSPSTAGVSGLYYHVRRLNQEFPWPSQAFLANNDAENLKLIDRQHEYSFLPSAETGKLKFLCQCYLGKKNGTVQSIGSLDFFSWPYRYSIAATNILYTMANGHYYLVKIEPPGYIKFYRIRFSPLAENIAQVLSRIVAYYGSAGVIANSALATLFYRLEAFVFCGFEDFELVKTFPFPTPEAIVGLPLAYGWKANWMGDQCAIVTYDTILTEAEDYDHHNFYVYLLDLAFSEQVINGTIVDYDLTASLTKQGPYYLKPRNLDIFVPLNLSYSYSMMEELFFVPKYDEDPTFSETPIYCYYDAEDQLVLFAYSYRKPNTGPQESEPSIDLAYTCNLETLDYKTTYFDRPRIMEEYELTVNRVARENRAIVPTANLTVPSDIIVGSGGSTCGHIFKDPLGIEATYTHWTTAGSCANLACCDPENALFALSPGKRVRVAMEGGVYDYRRESGNNYIVGDIAFIISRQSSESAFIANRERSRYQTIVTASPRVGRYNLANVFRMTILEVHPDDVGLPGPEAGMVALTRVHASGEGAIGIVSEIELVEQVTTFRDEWIGGAELILCAKTSLDTAVDSESLTGDDAEYLWSSIFDLTPLYPFIEIPFVANESVGGVIKHTSQWRDFSGSYLDNDDFLHFNREESYLPADAENKKYSVFCGWA